MMATIVSRRVAVGLAGAFWLCGLFALSGDDAMLGDAAAAESSAYGSSATDPLELENQDGRVELDVKSKYSHIRVRRSGDIRSLWFVRDSGEEVLESSLDLTQTHELQIDYTRFMFLSYMFKPKQEKVLIVGLGGGSMVHFLQHYEPEVVVEAVEIDPQVVRIADEYFGVRTEGNVKVVTADGLDYLARTEGGYDVIYMDAFLKPSRDTDRTGVPLRLKTRRFYKEIQTKLTTDGVVVFNLNPHASVREDIRTIRGSFPQAYVYELPTGSGYVVVASRVARREDAASLLERASELDRRFATSFSFRDMARHLSR